jgi:phage shock protein PspC (stress-responsive transcriptional regulator)
MGIIEDIERLQALRERGALSAEEFERAKAQILNQTNPAAGQPASDAGFGPTTHSGPSFLRKLARSRTDRLLGGVCGGLGEHTELPSWAWRLIFVVVTLYFGAGLLFYILLWIFLPQEQLLLPDRESVSGPP